MFISNKTAYYDALTDELELLSEADLDAVLADLTVQDPSWRTWSLVERRVHVRNAILALTAPVAAEAEAAE